MSGIFGTSTAPDHGVGMRGNTSGARSTGVFSQGDFAGVQGFTMAANGFGTSGVASGAGGHAVDAICNGACATSDGLAGNFQGNVDISGVGTNRTALVATGDVAMSGQSTSTDAGLGINGFASGGGSVGVLGQADFIGVKVPRPAPFEGSASMGNRRRPTMASFSEAETENAQSRIYGIHWQFDPIRASYKAIGWLTMFSLTPSGHSKTKTKTRPITASDAPARELMAFIGLKCSSRRKPAHHWNG